LTLPPPLPPLAPPSPSAPATAGAPPPLMSFPIFSVPHPSPLPSIGCQSAPVLIPQSLAPPHPSKVFPVESGPSNTGSNTSACFHCRAPPRRCHAGRAARLSRHAGTGPPTAIFACTRPGLPLVQRPQCALSLLAHHCLRCHPSMSQPLQICHHLMLHRSPQSRSPALSPPHWIASQHQRSDSTLPSV
jgi:hypothetical protein